MQVVDKEQRFFIEYLPFCSGSSIRMIKEKLLEKKNVLAKKGEPFKVRLWEDRTRGSRWTPLYDAACLKLIADSYERTQNIRVADTGMRYFEFVGIQTGNYSVVFELRYGWKFSADDRLHYDIEIVAQ